MHIIYGKKTDLQRHIYQRITQQLKDIYWDPEIVLKKDNVWKPLPYKQSYRSISHKWNIWCYVIHTSTIGIDVEILIPRDELLRSYINSQERAILWNKNRKNFYISWTAKESVFKRIGLKNTEDLNKIEIFKMKKIINTHGSFYLELGLTYKSNNYNAYVCTENTYIFAISY